MKVIGAKARTCFFYKKNGEILPNWNLIYERKCKSTEYELDKYLKDNKIKINPIAIIAKEQLSGMGQHSRKWISPYGGIWLSAAYPIYSNQFSAKTFSLSIATHFCEMFARESIPVKLKWPNDIIFDSKKLVGFLPKVVTRGQQITYARIGIGMNLNNYTPKEGISLSEIIPRRNYCEYKWTSKILKVICKAVIHNNANNKVINEANKYLEKNLLPRGYVNKGYSIKEIDLNGDLRIIDKGKVKILRF